MLCQEKKLSRGETQNAKQKKRGKEYHPGDTPPASARGTQAVASLASGQYHLCSVLCYVIK